MTLLQGTTLKKPFKDTITEILEGWYGLCTFSKGYKPRFKKNVGI